MSSLNDLHASLAARRCAARGCAKPSRPNGFFCSDACRARTWKQNHPGYPSPPGPKERQIAAERRRRAGSGPQLAYFKALRIVSEDLAPFVERSRVEAALRRALPERQRRSLESRA